MALRPEFEQLRGSLLHRSPLPTVDAALAELITEETRLDSQVPASLGSMDSVLAAAKAERSSTITKVKWHGSAGNRYSPPSAHYRYSTRLSTT
ncbi:unnamed protein product [Coffea canephora]|uniref:DH200=94 genomic scaffold, scaffold_9459 n=1 Tax=Coffea canephora TaxID=49390 RepID=A0A068VQP9_COFCA|nr:unnamed protein product [Coffea canephora]